MKRQLNRYDAQLIEQGKAEGDLNKAKPRGIEQGKTEVYQEIA